MKIIKKLKKLINYRKSRIANKRLEKVMHEYIFGADPDFISEEEHNFRKKFVIDHLSTWEFKQDDDSI